MQSMFAPTPQAGRPPLVTFKAGKMEMEEKPNGKFLISPILKKGQVSLVRGDDQLIHFQWKNRENGMTTDDFIMFPEDAAFQKVNTGKDQDRVYILQYKNSTRRFFFWMQELSAENDESLTSKLNEYMNNPPQANEPTGNAAGQLDQQAILQMLGAFGGGNAPGASGAGASATPGQPNSVQMTDLQSVLQNMGLPATTNAGANTSTPGSAAPAPATTTTVSAPAPVATSPVPPPASNATGGNTLTTSDLQRAMAAVGMAQQLQTRSTSLMNILSPENVASVLADEVCQRELLPLLPPGLQTPHELQTSMHAPPLRHGIASLESALRTGNYNAVIANFGLDHSAGATQLATGDFVGAFLAAVRDFVSRESSA